MKKIKENPDLIEIDDVRDIQRFVISNSFENIKFRGSADSVTLSDGAIVKADICDKKSNLVLRGRPQQQADVECAQSVPSLDSINPFIHQLLLRQRHFFMVKTADKNDWIMVRFTLFEPPYLSKKIGETRDTMRDIF